MDWIERWFGVAPDNGDGSLELLIILTVATIIIVVALWRAPRSRAIVQGFFTDVYRRLISSRRL